jgi:ribosomal protein S18 acetylase RimI-like enzyme
MTVNKARDAREVLEFYHDLIDKMKDSPVRPTWTRGVYPRLESLQAALEAGNLFTAEEDGRVVGAVIVTAEQDEAYSRVPWALATDRVAVIHLLAADPARHRSGIGTRLLEKAREVARERGAEAIRLDTLPYNTPARRLYEAFGFQYRGDLELYYPSAGRIPFSMYEYLL